MWSVKVEDDLLWNKKGFNRWKRWNAKRIRSGQKNAFELWNGLSILVGKHTEMLRSRVNSFLRWLQSSQNNESGSGGGKRLVLWGGKGKGRVKQGNENTIQLFFEVKI